MHDLPIAAEGPESEWKERPPAPERLARTLAAFHNGVGGRIWLGISDDGRIVGLDDLTGAKEVLRRAAALVSPAPGMTVTRRRTGGFELLEVLVARGDGPARVGRGGDALVYVRDGSASRPATPAQIRRMERGRVASTALDHRSRRLVLELSRHSPLGLSDLAHAARLGQRNTRRGLVQLLRAGLVHEGADGRFSLTPSGHRRA